MGDDVSDDIVQKVGYTDNEKEFDRYRLVIYPSDFFKPEKYGSIHSIPSLPLKIWDDTPLLYGEPKIEQVGNVRIIHADIIASTYFLISRYEEMVRRGGRDVHGRFYGKESLSYKAGFIDRPLVEEYGKLLRQQLRELEIEIPEPEKKIKKIFLTHDVDQLAHYRRFRGMMGAVTRGIKSPKKRAEARRAIKTFFKGIRFDPWYTFPWLFKIDQSLTEASGERCKTVVFIKAEEVIKKKTNPTPTSHTPITKILFTTVKEKILLLDYMQVTKRGDTPI